MVDKKEIKNYMDLDVWKKSHEFVIDIYKTTKDFPRFEIYSLISQLGRAAYSIPANIAEGNGKHFIKEYIQSLYISRASINEVRYFLLLSKDLGYLNNNKFHKLIKLLNPIEMMLMGLIRSLKRKLNPN